MFRPTLTLRIRPILLLAAVVLLLTACRRNQEHIRPDAAYAPYVPAFTSGFIPARSPILVRLSEQHALRDTSMATLQQLFQLDPKVAGTVSWRDGRTLAFTPQEPLEQDRNYTVTFALGRVLEVPKNLEKFVFSVATFAQHIEAHVVDMHSLSTTDLTWQRVEFVVRTSDHADPAALEACFAAEQNGKRIPLSWEHAADGRFHRLAADSVRRADAAGLLRLNWNGKGIGSPDNDGTSFTVPALNDLQWLDATTNTEGERSATLLFSDPLDPDQDLSGLAGINGAENVRLAIEGNKLILYPAQTLRGRQQAFVAGGLRNIMGRSLGNELVIDIDFEELKPSVRMVGQGTVLPSTDGLLLPFEAVNLNAVDVRIIRINADNIPQFLQVNTLDGSGELARVGRMVSQVTLPLDNSGHNGQWQRHYLDLDKLVRTEPGAIYRIALGFRAAHSAYPCGDGGTPGSLPLTLQEKAIHDDSWDQPYSYYYNNDDYYYEDEEYDYRQRLDPCSPSYYHNKSSVATRNVLASDLGLIAKRGNDGSMLLAVTDLRNTKPMSGVELRVLDLQRQVMATVTTDAKGMATVTNTRNKPFLVLASKGDQRGYLKVDDGSARNVSAFDVEGQAVEQGTKGFIYGERGVWRPGDVMHLTFILQSAGNDLPKDHPVTLELTDPQGRLDQRIVSTKGVNSVFAFPCSTATDAPTGIWNASITVGGSTFNKSLRVETVKPNRHRIELELGASPITAAEQRNVKLSARWLHGAPGRGLNASVTATTTRATWQPKGFDGYSFSDLGSDLDTEERILYEGQLDEDGRSSFVLQPEFNAHAPAAVRLNLVTRVAGADGDASTDRTDMLYLPFDSYVGIKLPEATGYWGNYNTDTTYQVSTVALSPAGKPLVRKRLFAQVVKTDHYWWWEGDSESLSGYMSAPGTRIISETEITTGADGRVNLPVRVDRPLWGTFVVRISDPTSGHTSASRMYFDWPGYGGRSRRDGAKEAAMLRFNTDREQYTVGDRCELIIPSPAAGRALVSLENGSRVLKAEWIDLVAGETRHGFPVTADMAPNVHAHVMVIQPHSAMPVGQENDLPIRLYGVVPVLVENAGTRLAPQVRMPAEIRTDEKFTVEVAEEKGREMTYTLAIVDEGLLDLTRFRTPDPWSHFYAREALGVRTWDLYDQVIGAVGRQLQRVLALGGSDQVDPKGAAKVNRFKPVVRFVGPFTLQKGKKANHEFTIDNYVGSVRAMVVASDGRKAYGHAEATAPVRKPLMVLATLPRVVGPGETVDLPVTVFAMDPKVTQAKVRLATNDLFRTEGPAERTVRFSKPGEQVVFFKVKVAERTGAGSLTVTAEGAGERAEQRIDIASRSAQLPITRTTDITIAPGASWTGTVEPFGTVGSNSAELEVSTLPSVDLGYRLKYLLNYPHGCLEQTTSAAFPQIFLGDVVELDEPMRAQARAHVEAGLRRVRTHQLSNGGFAYWPGQSSADDWSSIWVGHFMVEAEKAGIALPSGMRRPWVNYMRSAAREWRIGDRRHRSSLIQAYRLYVLALADQADAGAMNRLRTEPGLDNTSKWMLAAAYATSGRKDVARTIANTCSTDIPAYSEMAWTYGSDLRDRAIVAEALLAMDDAGGAGRVIKGIAKDMGSGNWYSTQSTAWGLLAISRLSRTEKQGAPMRFNANINGTRKAHAATVPMLRLPIETPEKQRSVTIENSGDRTLYVNVVRTGTPPPGEEQAASSGLVMEVEYRDMHRRPVDPARVPQGSDMEAVVTVYNPGMQGEYRGMALTQIFPSGWEIRNARMEGVEETNESPYTYRDVRDDRVLTYFDLAPRQQVTYRVRLTAAYAGRYHLPGAHCSAMYDDNVRANSAGRWVEVVREDQAVSSTP